MGADKPEVLDLHKLPRESADYLRAQEDRIAFLSELILEHKRRAALEALLEGHLALVPHDSAAEDKIIETMSALRG
jgi:hypothetical protein